MLGNCKPIFNITTVSINTSRKGAAEHKKNEDKIGTCLFC